METTEFIQKLISLSNYDLYNTTISDTDFLKELVKFNNAPNMILTSFSNLKSDEQERMIIGLSWLLPLSKNLFIFFSSRIAYTSFKEKLRQSNNNYITHLKEYIDNFSEDDFESIKEQVQDIKQKIKDISEENYNLITTLLTQKEEQKRLVQEKEKIEEDLKLKKADIESLKVDIQSLSQEFQTRELELQQLKNEYENLNKEYGVKKEDVLKELKIYQEKIKTIKDDIKPNVAQDKINKVVKPLIEKAEKELEKYFTQDLLDKIKKEHKAIR